MISIFVNVILALTVFTLVFSVAAFFAFQLRKGKTQLNPRSDGNEFVYPVILSKYEPEQETDSYRGAPMQVKKAGLRSHRWLKVVFVFGLGVMAAYYSHPYLVDWLDPYTLDTLYRVSPEHGDNPEAFDEILSREILGQAQYLKLDRIGESLERSVVVIPAQSISAQASESILRFIDKGGSLFVWWQQWQNQHEAEVRRLLSRVGINVETFKSNPSAFLYTIGESPVNHTLAAGSRFGFKKHKVLWRGFSGGRSGAYYGNWLRQPLKNRHHSALTYIEHGRGRLVLLGVPVPAWSDDPQFKTSIGDAIGWLRREPWVIKGAWPDAKRAALFVSEDTEARFANAQKTAALFEQAGYRGTFFVTASDAVASSAVLKSIADKHEVAYHGDQHRTFKGLSEDMQRKRVQKMVTMIDNVVSVEGEGFRPPYEDFDAETLKSLADTRVSYLFAGVNISNAVWPVFSQPVNDRRFVIIPRTMRDDVFYQSKKLSNRETYRLIVDEVEQIMSLGGVATFSFHSQVLAAHQGRGIVGELLSYAKSRDRLWLANGERISDWWASREAVEHQWSVHGRRGTLVLNVDRDIPAGLTFVMSSGWSHRRPLATSNESAITPKAVLLDEYRTALVFPALEKGDYRFSIDF